MTRTICVALASLLASDDASASGGWEDSASLTVTVNGHVFHDVKVVADGCKVTSTVRFDAPAKGYANPRNTVRNYHLFQARVKFARGQTAASKVFGNGGPGERLYTFESDTTSAGCWAKEANPIVKLDVIGCRGHSCDLGAFE